MKNILFIFPIVMFFLIFPNINSAAFEQQNNSNKILNEQLKELDVNKLENSLIIHL